MKYDNGTVRFDTENPDEFRPRRYAIREQESLRTVTGMEGLTSWQVEDLVTKVARKLARTWEHFEGVQKRDYLPEITLKFELDGSTLTVEGDIHETEPKEGEHLVSDINDLAPGQRWIDDLGDVWTVTDDLRMWTTSPSAAISPEHVFGSHPSLTLLPEQSDEPDMISHPPHYQTESGLEAIEVIEAFFPDSFHLGNAFKYLARAGKKGNVVEDLEKARWYLNREIARRKDAQ